jgi:hypothetical protein
MLMNPAWDKGRLPAFKLWLETKPSEERYHYPKWTDCACAQFLKSRGEWKNTWLGDPTMTPLNTLAGGTSSEWTFGQLLQRVNDKLAAFDATRPVSPFICPALTLAALECGVRLDSNGIPLDLNAITLDSDSVDTPELAEVV